MDLSLSEARQDDHLVVDVRGEVDLHSAPQVHERLTRLIDGGEQNLVVDLSQLAFIDSTGLGALVAAQNEANTAGVTMRIVCNSERLLKLFRITGLQSVFGIFSSVDEAVAAG